MKDKLRILETDPFPVKGGDKEAVKNILLSATKVISSARSKGIIHKNNAARKISRLTKKVNAVT